MAGVRGALLGGGTAFASAIGSVLVLAPLGIYGLPLAAIACIGGTFAGKNVCELAFAKQRNQQILKELKQQLQEVFQKNGIKMRNDRSLETWIEKVVSEQFNVLIHSMDDECVRIIKETENTMNGIRQELNTHKNDRSVMLEKYDKLERIINDLQETLKPIQEMLNKKMEVEQAEQSCGEQV